MEEVNAYNVGLGRLLRYSILVTSLRLQDINLRRKDREARRQERLQKIAEKESREEKKATDQNEYIDNLEQGVEFNEEEFLQQWLEKNPEVEIPPEVEDELDLDIEQDSTNN